MRRLAITLAFIVFSLSLGIHAQEKPPQRLILKDGSYQQVVKYEIHGDRVRYLSAERYEWEEVPYSLVDWTATKKWEQGRITTGNPNVRAADAEEEAERKAEEAKSPEVSPGIHLPSNGGVFLLDVYTGRPELLELQQNGSEINKNMKGNILRAAINPLASARQSIELKGAHAKMQAHLGQPVLYVNVPQEESPNADTAGPPQRDIPVDQRYRIVRLETKKNMRVVGNVKIAMTGKVSQQQTFLPTIVEQIAGGPWYKVMPASTLPPGEYAIAEMLGENQINLYVWDFGVNPAAPENPGAWKPATTAPSQPENTKPALEKRPPGSN